MENDKLKTFDPKQIEKCKKQIAEDNFKCSQFKYDQHNNPDRVFNIFILVLFVVGMLGIFILMTIIDSIVK